jgi:microcystin-dependent protein
MTYQVKYTETTNPSKPPLVVEDRIINNETSLTLPGKNYAGYGSVIGENFLHLLENFASGSEPVNPVEGQLWYDNSIGASVLKIYDGTSWSPAGSIVKASYDARPLTGNNGDIWVSTDTQQLFIYSGSTWVLVGPQYSVGLKTGPVVETVIDTNDISHNITSIYSDNMLVLIISSASFTPKLSIAGFSIINAGINITSVDSSAKIWGTTNQATALVVGGSSVAASKFIRSDASVPMDVPLSVRAAGGVSIGSDLSFNISTGTSGTILYSKTSGNSLSFNVTNNTTINTALHVTATSKIGINTTAPQEALDVNGNLALSGNIIVNSTLDASGATANDSASIFTNGGLAVLKTSQFGGALYTSDRLYLGLTTEVIQDSSALGTTIISPITDNIYDIGSPTYRFRNIYAQSFVGTFAGTFNGSFSGSITASKLSSSTTFRVDGDVVSNDIVFDGQNSGTAAFTTTVSSSIITGRPSISSATNADQILLYRDGIGQAGGLKRITKGAFVASIPTVPVGTILPFAGNTIPSGYLLCDGSEVLIADYLTLYGLIGYTYKPANLLVGNATFALPDLRGRFALGRDNMDNAKTIPSKTNIKVMIDAGGGAINRVVDATADVVGQGSGSEYRSITVGNLPEHKHNMRSSSAQYYAAGIPGAAADANATPGYGLPSSSSGSGLANSGGVLSDTHGDPLNMMNPYLTINYIIYTGG